jgi:hypothetical protein
MRYRRQGSPAEIALAKILEDVWETVVDHPDSGPFRSKVRTKEAPDYYKIIKDPIHLGTIRKVRTTSSLERDFENYFF